MMPWVLTAQAVKAMAYPTNGALMGALAARQHAFGLRAYGFR